MLSNVTFSHLLCALPRKCFGEAEVVHIVLDLPEKTRGSQHSNHVSAYAVRDPRNTNKLRPNCMGKQPAINERLAFSHVSSGYPKTCCKSLPCLSDAAPIRVVLQAWKNAISAKVQNFTTCLPGFCSKTSNKSA